MFGNLFEGDGDGPAKAGQGQGDAVPLPPAPRGRTNLAGIVNQGSTCFLNAVLQSLSFLPEFREAMFGLSPLELGFFEEKRRRVIPIELQKLLAALMLEQQQAVSSKQVTDSFGWANEVVQQHDVSELFSVLFTALSDSLKGTSGQNIVRDLLHITTVQKIICEGCGNITEKEGEESTLFLQVEGFTKGLEASLSNFCAVERMTGDNKYKCDVCASHQDAQKVIKVRKLPPLLMLALNRFSYDNQYRPYKVIDQFPFPMEISMGAYTEDGQSDPDLTYELTVVIVHSGGCGGGHYTACIRDVDSLGHWEMLDEKAYVPLADVVQKDLVDCMSAKQVVATVLSSLLKKSSAVTLDKLSAEIGKQTGVPWARQYKRRYGSFPKFLKENPDVFYVEDNLVTLVERPQENAEASPETSDLQNIDEGSSGDSASPKGTSHDKAEKQAQPGHNWFFFNDSRVAPMYASELKHEFGGKKSAYMLMYRKKTARRPPQAEGNPEYCIPEHLLTLIKQKNEDLQREREEYERKEAERKEEEERRKNEVQVDICYHFNCTVDMGMLSPKSPSFTHSFPKTMTLADLKAVITMLSSGNLQEGQYRLHRMKCFGEKTHLYEEFTDDAKTLEELSIDNGTILFAWDGYQVDEVHIPTGAASEPVILELVEYCHNNTNTTTHAFPKNLTLQEFRAQVSRLTGVGLDDLRLQFPEVTSLDTEAEQQTLASIQLRDHACVLYDSSNNATFAVDLCSSDVQTDNVSELDPMTKNGYISVRIENHCDKDVPAWKLDIDTSSTVGDVMKLFMMTYSIQCDSPVLQHMLPGKGIQPPYDENLTVKDADITADTHLILNRSKMDIEVKFFPELYPGQESLMVCVDKGCTVAQCMAQVARVAALADPEEWHLCTSNFMYDRLVVLEDPQQVLDSRFQQLLVEKGRLLPKDHIAVPLWLYPAPNKMWDPEDSALKMKDLMICENQQMSMTEPTYLGDIEIHKDEKLEKLRQQMAEVLTANHCPVTPDELRLRIIGGNQNRLRRVLRDPDNTLRRLKLENKTPIGIQIIGQGANLCKEEILVNVSVRNPQDKAYFPAQELLWDTRCGASAFKLRQDIAQRLGVPGESLVIAKHCPAEFRWKILKDVTQTPTNRTAGGNRRGRKRGTISRPNICQKPYCVEDGDDIGVICQLNVLESGVANTTAVTEDDFLTWEDEQGRQKIEEEIRKKQEERQAKSLNGLSFPQTRQPEVPLKIQVQDYS